jgi:hypothetical protein
MRSHPRCYGMAVVVSAQSAVCQRCESRSGCLAQASIVASKLPDSPLTQVLRQHIALVTEAIASSPHGAGEGSVARVITASTRGVVRIDPTQVQLDYLTKLPPKIAGFVDNMIRRGWIVFARQELMAGRNPARNGWKYSLCESILACESRSDFSKRLAKSGLNAGSVKAQSSLALAIFKAAGLLLERNGQLVVSQNHLLSAHATVSAE